MDEFGFWDLLDELMRKYMTPMSSVLFPEWGGGSLDGHHGFAVQYKIGEDEDLDYHMDSSEITLNACLGKNFTGGSVFFQVVVPKIFKLTQHISSTGSERH